MGFSVTYYGHSCFGVESQGINLLFDPFITPNELASNVDISSIPADYILLSHGHEDHVADAEAIARNTDATIISSYEVVNWFIEKGIQKGHPMNLGGSKTFDFGTVKCVNAVHSSVMPDGKYGGNPMGFVIKSTEGSFYYAGDTALTYDMKLIGEYHKPDFAFLPVGDNFTMGPDDAIIAAGYSGVSKVIGMHFDTFGYRLIDHKEVASKYRSAGIDLTLPVIGRSINPLKTKTN